MSKISKNNKNKGKKVFVGLSGGVDSAVSAALLKKEGYEVTGVFIKVWQPDWIKCTSKEDRLDAMRVATKLEIPFITLDLEKEYKKEVVDYMIKEYSLGRTPNPDVMCNKYIKFGSFFDFAIKNGANYIATGHYARIKKTNSAFNLVAGIDNNKDQSYFLWTLRQEQLSKIIFPVGELKKEEVRKLAQKLNLPVYDKKDSQGVCFIGKIDFKDFLSHFIKNLEGDVLDEEGHKIGMHDGSVFLTIGERRGFNITKKTSTDKPYYVISKDVSKNTITVSHTKSGLLKDNSKNILLNNLNWISGVPNLNRFYSARIRYRQMLLPCKIRTYQSSDLGIVIEFKKNFSSPAIGQSVVVYDKEICLGGGIIEAVI